MLINLKRNSMDGIDSRVNWLITQNCVNQSVLKDL
jgi:hypothetical protein